MNMSGDRVEPSLSLAAAPFLSRTSVVGRWLVVGGVAVLVFALASLRVAPPGVMFILSIGLMVAGVGVLVAEYARNPAGIDNDSVVTSGLTARGISGWILGILLTAFYVVLYWYPHLIGGMVRVFDPLSEFMRGREADQWFMYGFFYTLAVVLMGARALVKFRHIRYQIIRTLSVVFVQLILAFVLPSVLVLFNQPELYFSYFWPLDYDLLWPSQIGDLWSRPGYLGAFAIVWGGILTFVGTPILTYFFGKRWYCSWVCGCGGLAETAGDPFRQLSDKRLVAWKVERWLVHGILAAIVLLTLLLWVNTLMGGGILGAVTGPFMSAYGFYIGAIFSGVVGVGFYPVMGSRVWCRFGCPMAAILGLLQKYFSRFRITTNGGQCISCGNCSTYCEMGIDVRWYAQRGQNIVRASCVGCGICSAVCPRGVLKLENGPKDGRVVDPSFVGRDSVGVL
ncbi:MAG: 4Fe-4S binding protein [Rhodothermales bacterium]|nr:4Fe-4S binding protein [Rhodothermales bacterium]